MSSLADIEIRKFGPSDSIAELTTLLHRAYAPLGAVGLNYTAVDQDADVTRERVDEGTCYLAIDDTGRICGTIAFHEPPPGESPTPALLRKLQDDQDGAAWLKQPGVAHFGQFAVDPDVQSQGLGTRLMDTVEARARALNAKEIALDTAEPAAHLIALYMRRGYRTVGYAQWRGKKYRSAIMSKTL